MKASYLPEHMLRCVNPAERKKLGVKTAQESIEAAEIKSEKDLQKQIVALLNLKGIEVNVSRMDKRKTDRVGWPDLTFAVNGRAVAWEVKLNGTLSPEQTEMMLRLYDSPNGWLVYVVRSVQEALEKLKAMGIE